MPRRKTELDIASLATGLLAPGTFFEALTHSLELHILSSMGKVSETKLESFGIRLYTVALDISQIAKRLALAELAEQPIRSGRLRCSRARKAIGHSLDQLRKAESISKEMIDKDGLLPECINFQPARRELEDLEKTIRDLESTTAALIHPNLRKEDSGAKSEKILAENAPVKLYHPDFKVTPGSQQLLYHAVETLDDEIEKFTHGKVRAGLVNTFISEFLKFAFDWTVTVENMNTIRNRNRERKKLALTSSILPTPQ